MTVTNAYHLPSWEARVLEEARAAPQRLEYLTYAHAFGRAQGLITILTHIIRRADDERPEPMHAGTMTQIDRALSLAAVASGQELRSWLTAHHKPYKENGWEEGLHAALPEIQGLTYLVDTYTRR